MEVEDSLTHSGAYRLCEKIRLYWLNKNKDIKIWVEKIVQPKSSGSLIWGVRSDMVNGYPKR